MLRQLVMALALLGLFSASIRHVEATGPGAKSPKRRKMIRRKGHGNPDKRPEVGRKAKADNADPSRDSQHRLREAPKRPTPHPPLIKFYTPKVRGTISRRKTARDGSPIKWSAKLLALERQPQWDKLRTRLPEPLKPHHMPLKGRRPRHRSGRRGGDPAQQYVGLDAASVINITSSNVLRYSRLARRLLRKVKNINNRRREAQVRQLPEKPLVEEEMTIVRLRKAINRYYRSNPTATHPTKCVCDAHYRGLLRNSKDKSRASKGIGRKALPISNTDAKWTHTRRSSSSDLSAVVSLVRHRSLSSDPLYRGGRSLGSPNIFPILDLPPATIMREEGRKAIAKEQSVDKVDESRQREDTLADLSIRRSWAGLGAIQVPEKEPPHVAEVPGIRPPGLQHQPIYEQLGAVVAYCTLAFVLVATLGMAGILSNIRLRKHIGEATAGSRFSIAPEDGIQLKVHVRRDSIQALPI